MICSLCLHFDRSTPSWICCCSQRQTHCACLWAQFSETLPLQARVVCTSPLCLWADPSSCRDSPANSEASSGSVSLMVASLALSALAYSSFPLSVLSFSLELKFRLSSVSGWIRYWYAPSVELVTFQRGLWSAFRSGPLHSIENSWTCLVIAFRVRWISQKSSPSSLALGLACLWALGK